MSPLPDEPRFITRRAGSSSKGRFSMNLEMQERMIAAFDRPVALDRASKIFCCSGSIYIWIGIFFRFFMGYYAPEMSIGDI